VQETFTQQIADQKTQVEELKSALRQLEQKLAEARSMSDVLIAQHRRARALSKASDARLAMTDGTGAAAFDRMQKKIQHSEAVSQAKSEMLADNTEEKLSALDKQDRVEQLLADLKARRKTPSA
jgi:phage shock protein A